MLEGPQRPGGNRSGVHRGAAARTWSAPLVLGIGGEVVALVLPRGRAYAAVVLSPFPHPSYTPFAGF